MKESMVIYFKLNPTGLAFKHPHALLPAELSGFVGALIRAVNDPRPCSL